jgi:hypothetical protein
MQKFRIMSTAGALHSLQKRVLLRHAPEGFVSVLGSSLIRHCVLLEA